MSRWIRLPVLALGVVALAIVAQVSVAPSVPEAAVDAPEAVNVAEESTSVVEELAAVEESPVELPYAVGRAIAVRDNMQGRSVLAEVQPEEAFPLRRPIAANYGKTKGLAARLVLEQFRTLHPVSEPRFVGDLRGSDRAVTW